MKPALLIIDLQKAFHEGPAAASMDAACEYINEVLPYFRKKGLPVIWIQDADQGSGVVPGAEGFELLEALKPLEGEHRITKTYGNAFNKTDLASILEREGVDMPVLSGYCAEHCVLSTYRGALDRDLTPIILHHGIASGKAEALAFVEGMSNLIGYAALEKVLG